MAAILRVPRHLFVPGPLASVAYQDMPLPIEAGQTISQPYIVALMIEAAGIAPGARVLEIGAGSGYMAALLARRAERVVSLEIDPALAEMARTYREAAYSLDPHTAVAVAAARRGIEVQERAIWPEELESFEQMFLTGSAAEVTPVAEAGQPAGKAGKPADAGTADEGKKTE